MKMRVEERDRLLQEMHVVLLGVKDTEENGLVGHVMEIKEVIREQNGRHRRLSKYVWILWGVVVVGGGYGVFSLLWG